MFRLLLSSFVAIALVPAARADQVTMVNGDRLSGTVVHKAHEDVLLRTTYAGEIRLRLAEVKSVVTDGPVELLLDDGTLVHMRLVDVEPAFELSRIRYINPTPEESGNGYLRETRVALALSRMRGNSTTDQYHGSADLALRAKDHRYTMGADGNYGRDDGIATTSNWRGKLRYDRFFAPKEFLYARIALENDRYKDIRLRSQAGGGYGYQIYEDDATALNLRGGLAYVTVRHYDISCEEYGALSWGLDLRHRLRLFVGELFHAEEGTRALDSRHGTVLQTKTGLRLPLGEQLSATAQVNVDWESKPSPGRKETDTTLLLGLGYVFR